MSAVILALFASSLLIFYLFILPQLYWKRKNVKQNFPIPFAGDLWPIFLKLDTMSNFIKSQYSKFPNERYFGIYQGPAPTLVIKDPELIKKIAIKDFDYFVDHRSFIGVLETDDIWNKNLFALKGHEWKEMRSILSPSFTASKMRSMFPLMKQSAEQFVTYYLEKDDRIELEVKNSFTRFANDVIANCAFGLDCDSLKEPENEFFRNGSELTDFSGFAKVFKFFIIPSFPRIAKMLNLTVFAPYLGNYFQTLVRDTISYREEKNIVRPDMINLLMEAKKGLLKYGKNSTSCVLTDDEPKDGRTENRKFIEMTDMDMAAQVAIFFVAGFDTVSTAMTFMCYSLAVNPNVQMKLLKEVDETFKATKGKLTYEALAEMNYMDMVISESLRKFPPVLAVDRTCTKSYSISSEKDSESNVTLNVGDNILIPIYGIHNDPDYYPSPERFVPERFAEENKEYILPYTFLPFGLGPRNCIGSRFALMEIKLIFYHLLLKFKVVPTEKTPTNLELIKGTFNPIIKGGCWLGLERY